MSEFGIFMLIFAGCVFLTGLYAYTGHKIEMLAERPAFKNLNINDWKNIGKWVIYISIFIFIIGIIGIIFNIK